MQAILLSHEEVAQRAEQLYESRIRQEIAPYYFIDRRSHSLYGCDRPFLFSPTGRSHSLCDAIN